MFITVMEYEDLSLCISLSCLLLIVSLITSGNVLSMQACNSFGNIILRYQCKPATMHSVKWMDYESMLYYIQYNPTIMSPLITPCKISEVIRVNIKTKLRTQIKNIVNVTWFLFSPCISWIFAWFSCNCFLDLFHFYKKSKNGLLISCMWLW